MRNLLLFAAFILCALTAGAQVTVQKDTTSFDSQMSAAFSALEKNRVPFGILQDYAMEFTNLQAYNGTILADSTKNTYATVLDIYNTLVSGIIYSSAGTFHHPIYIDSLWQTKRQPGVVVLGGLFYQYSAFKDNAASSGLVTVSNNKIYDKYVSGVWQNPYQTANVFAMSAPLNLYNSNGTHGVQIVLPSSLWLTNSSSLISSMQADFADGSGFRTLTKDQTYNLSYSSGGTKTWTFKVTLTSGTVLQSQSDFVFDSSSSGGGYSLNRNTIHTGSLCNLNKWDHLFDMPNGVTDAAVAVTADDAFDGQKASGWYTIHYANADRVLRKPLIVAEGFDWDDVLKPEETFGSNTLQTLLDSLSLVRTSPLYTLLADPANESYDIIYVDWKHSGDFIERNALLLETVIKKINILSGNLPIVLMGRSMGGLASRYALRDMEIKAGGNTTSVYNHHVRMFISYDSPQQGANVPLAFQYLSRQARSIYYNRGVNSVVTEYNTVINAINLERSIVNTVKSLFNGAPAGYLKHFDLIRDALGLQDQPSAREMLINYVGSDYQIDNIMHSDWQTTLRNLGYPKGFSGQVCNLVALSNGSECATTQPYNPGDALLDISGSANTRFLGDMLGEVAASLGTSLIPGFMLKNPSLLLAILPGKNTFNIQFVLKAQPDATAVNMYTGSIKYTKKLLYLISITNTISSVSATSSASTLPYDYFPGGQEPTGFNFKDVSFKNALVKYSLNVNTQQAYFCFVPAASALDVGLGAVALTKADYLTKYIGATPPPIPKNIPFTSGFTTASVTFSGNPNNNEQHISITSRHDADWIYNQIVGTPKNTNCTAFCGYTGILSIGGTSKFCGNQTFTLSGTLPPSTGRTIKWTYAVIGTGNIALSQPLNQTSVGASGTSGYGTLDALVILSDANGSTCAVTDPTLSIASGGYGSGDYPITGPSSACFNQPVTFRTNTLPAATSYNWFYPSNWTYTDGQGTTALTLRTGNTTSNGQVGVRVATACDQGGSPAIQNVSVSSCFIAYPTPNPAVNSLRINIDNNSPNFSQQKIHEIILADRYGTIKKHTRYSDGVLSANLNVSDLIDGVYFLRVSNGNNWSNSQIIISR